jgi:hypothetical protein
VAPAVVPAHHAPDQAATRRTRRRPRLSTSQVRQRNVCGVAAVGERQGMSRLGRHRIEEGVERNPRPGHVQFRPLRHAVDFYGELLVGNAWNSAHDHETGWSTAPPIVKSHAPSYVYGVGPADNTGKSRVTYCPGGTREESAAARRPRNPLVTAIRPSRRAACAAAIVVSPASRPP